MLKPVEQMFLTKVYLGPCQTSVIKIFVRTVNDNKLLCIFAKKFHYRYLIGY